MIYDSLDIIPLKLFLKILDTGNYTLLTDDKTMLSECEKLWKKLENDFEKLGYENNMSKIIDISARIEALKFKYDAVIAGVQSLRFDRNIDIENMMRSFRYKISELTYKEDLDRIEREVASINIKIKRLERMLPEEDNKSDASTIDKVIMGYCAITTINYDTNLITVTQFHALKSLADDKMKAIERQNTEIKNKQRNNGRRNNHS